MILASWSPQRGLDPTPAEARRWLSDELSGSDYHDPWMDSAIRWILDQLGKLLDGANNLTHGALSPVITVAVALVVIALLVWVVPRVRRESVAAASDRAVLEDLTITARTYRDRASRAFEEGRLDDVVLDGFRAIAKDTSDRTLLDDAPGRTAHEVSLALAQPFPGHADRLVEAANSFDAIRYGHRHATAAQATQVLQLDADLARARPSPATPTPLQDLSV
jgi:hypothetical protein